MILRNSQAFYCRYVDYDDLYRNCCPAELSLRLPPNLEANHMASTDTYQKEKLVADLPTGFHIWLFVLERSRSELHWKEISGWKDGRQSPSSFPFIFWSCHEFRRPRGRDCNRTVEPTVTGIQVDSWRNELARGPKINDGHLGELTTRSPLKFPNSQCRPSAKSLPETNERRMPYKA